jgi:hypothetical protein
VGYTTSRESDPALKISLFLRSCVVAQAFM